MSKFSERLKELRTEEGLSQAQLAKMVGVSHVAITYWETNKRVPNLDAVIALAKYFGVSLDYIAGLED
ncbi:MAG: helix-turn-helix transcriptional regulator [Candidatus Caccovivens sp.]